jgi:hypothetical protein
VHTKRQESDGAARLQPTAWHENRSAIKQQAPTKHSHHGRDDDDEVQCMSVRSRAYWLLMPDGTFSPSAVKACEMTYCVPPTGSPDPSVAGAGGDASIPVIRLPQCVF